jgi:hypothetical protein
MAMTDECNTGSHEVCSGVVDEQDTFAVICACGCHATVWPTGHVPLGLPLAEVPSGVREEGLPAVDEESLSDQVPDEVPAPA